MIQCWQITGNPSEGSEVDLEVDNAMTSTNQTNRHILHIEDDDDYAFLIRHHLSDSVHHNSVWFQPEITHFGTVTDGIDWLDHNPHPDAVILDLNLPDYSGLETYLALHAAAPEIPTLIISGEEKVPLAVACIEHGAGGYIPKAKVSAEQIFIELEGAFVRHRQSREALVHNEVLELLRTGVMILRNDHDGWKFSYANRTHQQWFGPSPEDRDTPVSELGLGMDPADKNRLERAIRLAIEKGRATLNLSMHATRRGGQKWYQFSMEKLEAVGQEFLVIRTQDQSEVRLVAEAARRNASELEAVIERSERGIIVLDRGNRIQVFNSQARFFGQALTCFDFDRKRFKVGKPPVHKELQTLIEKSLTGEEEHIEAQIDLQDGGLDLLIRSTPITNDKGKVDRVLLQITDFTGYRARERSLTRAAEEWRYTFDGAEEVIVVIAQDGRVLRLNTKARELLVLPYDELVFQPWSLIRHLFPFDDAGLVSRSLDRRIRGEANVMDPNTGAWYKLRAFPLKDDLGSYFGMVLFCQDISADRRLAEMSRLHAWNETMGQLSAGVAHELRNISFAIDAAMFALDKKLPPQGEWRKYLDVVTVNVDRMHESINKLVEFQSIGRKMEPTALFVGELLEEAMSTVVDKKLTRGWTVDCDAKLKCYADRNTVVQALVEVMGNALQEKPEQKMTIEARGQNREFIVIRILDKGEGFADDAMLRAFEPFFTTRTGQSGLGLAKVKLIVSLHGGLCDFGNRPEGGGWFEISLPRTHAAFRRHSPLENP